jgi:hypothetical protein
MIGLKIGGGLPNAIRWFEHFHQKVFDWLEIPKDASGMVFREIGGRVILQGIRGERLAMPDGREGPYVRWDHFSEEVRAALRGVRYKRPAGSDRLSAFNLDCHTCHRRAWDFSKSISSGYARWKTDSCLLSPEPGQELTRHCERENPRDWAAIWKWAGGKLYDGRMIAHPQDAIWVKLSRFGVPWTPLEIDSGMGMRSLRWREAKEIGFPLDHDGPKIVTGWWDLPEEG